MKKLITGILILVLVMLVGCVSEARTPEEVLARVEVGMTKGEMYDVVDGQHFRDSLSLLGVTISEMTASRKGRVLDFTVGDYYSRLYYGLFFFDVDTDSEVTLVVFGWNDDTVAATGTVPFARAQEIAEEKYGQPFRRDVSKGIDVVVLVPLTEYADESYWHWLETGELPQEVIDGIATWDGYYLVD